MRVQVAASASGGIQASRPKADVDNALEHEREACLSNAFGIRVGMGLGYAVKCCRGVVLWPRREERGKSHVACILGVQCSRLYIIDECRANNQLCVCIYY
jgi:hypothetical protein